MPLHSQAKLPPAIAGRAATGAARGAARSGPLWEGPAGQGPNGGVTQSMLSKFLTDPERFRLAYVEGWKPVEQWNHRTGYGSMWHVCEESLAGFAVQDAHGNPKLPTHNSWESELKVHAQGQVKRFRMQQDAIEHWYQVCKTQFPLYVEWWAEHAETVQRTPLLQEQNFDVAYQLPSGREVRLRGRWDAVDLIEKGKAAGIWIQDHKTKGDVDCEAIRRQMSGDLQLMFYMVALSHGNDGSPGLAVLDDLGVPVSQQVVKGVRLNVVRRPLGGGKGSIVRGKAKAGAKCSKCKGAGMAYFKLAGSQMTERRTCPKCGGAGRIGAMPEEPAAAFYTRLGDVIRDAHGPEWDCPPGEHFFFKRWSAEVSANDLRRFRDQTLDPLLERLSDWWDWISSIKGRANPFAEGGGNGLHWRHPYGADNAIDTWGSTDLDGLADSGSTVGLERREALFEELK